MSNYRLLVSGSRCLIQENDTSSTGNCFWVAVGNALLVAQYDNLFPHGKSTRNLSKVVQGWISELINIPEVSHAMMRHKALWEVKSSDPDYGWQTIGEYDQNHLQNTRLPRQMFGTTFDLALLARYLQDNNCLARMVVYTKKDKSFVWQKPFAIDPAVIGVDAIPAEHIDAEDITEDDIIIINTGNNHWSRARWTDNDGY